MIKTGTRVFLMILMFAAAGVVQAQIPATAISADATASSSVGMEGVTEATPSDTEAVGSAEASLSIDRNDLKDGTQYFVSRADEVLTPASFEAYIGSVIQDDERVEEISVTGDEIEIHYKIEAKFLWFVPTDMVIRATVSPEGSVTVSYPWYAFLIKTPESRAALETRLNHDLSLIADDLTEDIEIESGNTTQVVPMNDARRRALIVERIRYSLYAQGSAEARQ